MWGGGGGGVALVFVHVLFFAYVKVAFLARRGGGGANWYRLLSKSTQHDTTAAV